MDALLVPQSQGSGFSKIQASARAIQKHSIDAEIIDNIKIKSAKSEKNDELIKSLYYTAQEVLTKLNDILKDALPEGIQSLNPDEYTPEKTAQRIVDTLSGLFELYAEQNKDKSGEELVASFMKSAKSGVEQGYSEAFEILESIGAFDVPGVKAGVEETKNLLDQKLVNLEELLLKRFASETNSNEKNSKYTPSAEVISTEYSPHNLDLVA